MILRRPRFPRFPLRHAASPRCLSTSVSSPLSVPAPVDARAGPPLKILYFGSCDFSVTCLRALLARRRPGDLIEVVTPPDDPSRANFKAWPHKEVPLRLFALGAGLQTYTAPPRSLTGWEPATDTAFDLGVVVSFGYFIPRRIIRRFSAGTLNVHPSLLPRFRGPAPLHHTLLHGDKWSGVSIIELDESQFDAGRILKQTRVAVPENCTFTQFERQMARLGGHELAHVVANYSHYKKHAVPQGDPSGQPAAPKITKTDAQVHLSRSSALSIWRMHLAVGHMHDLYCMFGSGAKELRLLQLRHPADTAKELRILLRGSAVSVCRPAPDTAIPPGAIIFNPITDTLFIRTGPARPLDSNDVDDDEYDCGWFGVRSLGHSQKGLVDARAFVLANRLRNWHVYFT